MNTYNYTISKNDLQKIVNKLNYSKDQQELIESDKPIITYFFGVSLRISDKKRYTTKEGILEQVSDFPLGVGLVYYLDSNLEMKRLAISLVKEK